MKNNNIKIAFLSLLSLSIISCEKEVEIDIDQNEQKIVLNTWLKPGESPEVEVSYSSFIFNKTGIGYLDNASVVMLEEGIKIGELNHIQEGYYTNQNIELKDGTNYQFEISHENYVSVFATEKIPSRIEDEKVEISYQNNPNANYTTNTYASTININIKDDADEENYYLARVAANETYWYAGQDTMTTKNYIYMEPIDPQILDTYLPSSGAHFILSDEIFNGKQYEMKFGSFNDLRQFEYQQDSTYYHSGYYEIEFHKINRALYLYLRSISNNEFPGPFTEPTQIYSNVENGYGIVGASSFTKLTIEETNDDGL